MHHPQLSKPRGFAVFAGTAFIAVCLSHAWARRVDPEQPQRYIEHVKYLASPELQGRGAGTPGLERASEYIAGEFKKLELDPAGEENSYWQSFSLTTNSKPGPGNKFSISGASAAPTLRFNEHYVPISFSSGGQVDGPVVFAGYGITAPEFHHDDYQGLDVKDKIVLVVRYEPKSFRKDARAGRQSRRQQWTHHAHLISKAINARNHGARAVILVNDESDKDDKLIRFGTVAGPADAGILMVQLKRSVAQEWLKAGSVPAAIRAAITVDIVHEKATVRNVIGYLPGKTDEYIIVGAHYDHLGHGNQSSLAPAKIGQVHPGADDNASGTAGLLEVARILSARRGELKRGVLFMAFAGEELGLLGSARWVDHPTRNLADAVAMLNMDMIGRVNGGKLFIGGTATGSTFMPILKDATQPYDFKIDYSKNGYSASDHTSFARKSIPVLFFFSGLHGDYHKPSDTWNKISGPDSVQVVNLVSDIATRLIAADVRPQFVKIAEEKRHTAPAEVNSGGSYGPYFGSIPDFAQNDTGVKFSDVRAGSPAAKAGLQAGDTLIEFGGQPIRNLHDFTFALRNSKAGEVVNVKFLRQDKEITASVTLEARP
jgi:Zn-dependent M28 family amino/carboxypeptidase